MKRWQFGLAGSAALVLALTAAPHAQNIVIKLATVVPEGSIWDKNVRQMGADWQAATGDRVSVTGHKAKPPISYNVRKFAVLVRILLPRLAVDTADARECRLMVVRRSER